MVTFREFPVDHWNDLRTTNVVESPFAAVRLRNDATKRFKKADSAATNDLEAERRRLMPFTHPLTDQDHSWIYFVRHADIRRWRFALAEVEGSPSTSACDAKPLPVRCAT
jgi:hypothetical protein